MSDLQCKLALSSGLHENNLFEVFAEIHYENSFQQNLTQKNQLNLMDAMIYSEITV